MERRRGQERFKVREKYEDEGRERQEKATADFPWVGQPRGAVCVKPGPKGCVASAGGP